LHRNAGIVFEQEEPAIHAIVAAHRRKRTKRWMLIRDERLRELLKESPLGAIQHRERQL